MVVKCIVCKFSFYYFSANLMAKKKPMKQFFVLDFPLKINILLVIQVFTSEFINFKWQELLIAVYFSIIF